MFEDIHTSLSEVFEGSVSLVLEGVMGIPAAHADDLAIHSAASVGRARNFQSCGQCRAPLVVKRHKCRSKT
jgi:hypothetical protein